MITKEERLLAKTVAAKVWLTLDKNQKTGIRFGMFPAEVVKEHSEVDSHEFCMALMDEATKDGGMIA